MATFVASCVMLAWATPALTGTIVWKWIFDDTSGLVTWLFNALPDGLSSSLFGRSDWTGYGWFNSPLLFFADPHPGGGLALVPVHRGERAGRAEERAERAARGGPGRRRRPVAGLLEDHLPAAAAGLRDPGRALHDLGLQGLHPAVRAGRRHPGPADVHAVHLLVRRGFLAAAEVRPRRGDRGDPHADPARGDRPLRPHGAQAGGGDREAEGRPQRRRACWSRSSRRSRSTG